MTQANNLYIDIGNTRLKWLINDKKMQAINWQNDKALSTLLNQWCRLNINNAYIISTANQKINTKINHFLNQNGVSIKHFNNTQKNLPITPNYDDPNQLGKDRLAALIAANKNYPTVCVISCGTAITVDFCHNGKHNPGLIIPGINAIRSVLNGQTNDVNTQKQDYKIPPKNTQQCVQLGIEYAICGAIEKLFTHYQKKINSPIVTLITGGDAKWLNTHLSIPAKIDETLNIKGLKIAFHQ